MSKRPRVRARPEPRDDIIHLAIRISLLALLVYWSFVLVQPFIPIMAWGTILTVALYPAFDWLARKLGGRRVLSAILITVCSLIVVIGPVTWLALGLVDGLQKIADQLGSSSFTVPLPPPGIKEWPIIGDRIYEFWSMAESNLASALATITPHLKPLAKSLLGLATSAGEGIFKFLMAVVLMGFLFTPGPRMLHGMKMFLMHVVPERSDEFLALTGETIRSVSQGVLGVSVLQALLAGFGFRIAEVPGANILTFLILFLSIAQVGAQLVLLGVIVWIWTATPTAAALLFTAYFVVVGLLDNILKPIVMGHGLRTPMLVILVGVLGGTFAHGLLGLFVGPVVLAVVWQLMLAWMRDNPPEPEIASSTEAASEKGRPRSLAGADN